MRFKVMCGSFSMADRLYKAGDVVETSYLLDKMFPKKYKRIDGFVSNIREDAADVVPETDEWMLAETKPTALPMRVPTFTVSPFLTTG